MLEAVSDRELGQDRCALLSNSAPRVSSRDPGYYSQDHKWWQAQDRSHRGAEYPPPQNRQKEVDRGGFQERQLHSVVSDAQDQEGVPEITVFKFVPRADVSPQQHLFDG